MSLRSLVLALVLMAIPLLVAACGAPTPEGGCLEPRDGELVRAPCEVEGTTVPTPTATVPQANGNGNGGLPAGAQVFLDSGCGACHAHEEVPGAPGGVGPDLTTVPEGPDYIRESIVALNAVIADECPAGPCSPNVMPGNFEQLLSEEDIDQLVDFLAAGG